MKTALAVLVAIGACSFAPPVWSQDEEEEQLAEAAEAAEAAEGETSTDDDPNIVLSYDGWFLRADVGLAYTHTVTRHHPVGDDSDKRTLEADGLGPTLDLAVAARLGRDVTLGGLGQLVHSPATLREDDAEARAQGLYYAAVFVDHRLPWSIVHLGGGAGGGYIYASGPDDESIGGLGPVGTLWLGLDFPSSSRVALGVVFDVVGAAMKDEQSIDGGGRHEFDTFLLVIGASFTLRISEPSWPDSFPPLARR